MIKISQFGFQDRVGKNELDICLHITGNDYRRLRKLSERRNIYPHEFIIDVLKQRTVSKRR